MPRRKKYSIDKLRQMAGELWLAGFPTSWEEIWNRIDHEGFEEVYYDVSRQYEEFKSHRDY